MLENYQVVDLTHTLDGKVPTWGGSCEFCSHILSDYSEGCRVLQYEMAAGVGTHMDAPSHFIRGGCDVADLAVENFVVPLIVLHIDRKGEADYFLSVADIKEHESTYGQIPKGALVVANFNWSSHWTNPHAYRNLDSLGVRHFPGFSSEAAEVLLERGVVGIGLDTLSPDGGNTDFPVHHLLLSQGKYIIENLSLPSYLPPKGAIAVALPPKIRAGTEAICRVIALWSPSTL